MTFTEKDIPLLVALASLGWSLNFLLIVFLWMRPRAPAQPVEPGEPPLDQHVQARKPPMGGP